MRAFLLSDFFMGHFLSTTHKPITIAIDCMGGDVGPTVTLPACLQFLGRYPQVELILVGRPDIKAISPSLSTHPRCRWIEAQDVVAMDDTVETALRRRKNSSMRVAIEYVKSGEADAVVSAGNTGALMATARYVLKTLEGIDRPAIASQLPNQTGGSTTVLDLGANVDCTAEHLLQFAVMGSALVTAVTGVEQPSIGLLNVGEEVIKGNDTIKQAGELLRMAASQQHINFFGNVEGNDIFKGTTHIVVCDGFVGNVALKASEGLASMISGFIRQEFSRNWLTKCSGLLAYPVLTAFKKRVDHRRYNGAALLGLRGLVFKSHGSADAFAFEQALIRAHDAARHGLIAKVQTQIANATLMGSHTPVALS